MYTYTHTHTSDRPSFGGYVSTELSLLLLTVMHVVLTLHLKTVNLDKMFIFVDVYHLLCTILDDDHDPPF